jgi:hypothetical protein
LGGDYPTARLGDFNGDGKADILWRDSSGTNAIWLMDGLVLSSSALIPGVSNTAWTIAGVGDFNGDGPADILWRNTSGGDNAVWLMNGFTPVNTALIPSVPTSWGIAGSLIAAALNGARLAFEGFRQTVNAQGANLAGSHLVGSYDLDFLGDGLGRTLDSGNLAEGLRGLTVNSFTLDRVISYDDAAEVVAVVTSLNTSAGIQTANEQDGGLVFRKQADGTWKLYGNRRPGESGVNVEMQTDRGPGGVTAPPQRVSVDFRPPQGTVSSVTITGGNGLFNNTPVPISGTEFVSVQADPPPAAPVTYFLDTYFAGADSALTGTPSFTFTVTPTSGPAVTYTIPSNTVTNQFVTITSPTGTMLADAMLGSARSVTWTLPGFTIAEVQLGGHVATAVLGGVECQISEQILATNATSGNVMFPTTCNGQPVQSAVINLNVNGVNGGRTIYIYQFSGN